MKTHVHIFLLVMIGCLLTAVSLEAETVETWDGQWFEGTILSGIPDVISLDENEVTIDLQIDTLLEIAFGEDRAVVHVTTIFGSSFEGTLLSSITAVTVSTASAETEIPKDHIQRIVFPHEQTEPPSYQTTVELRDGRGYKGDISTDFPDPISIDVNGITSTVSLANVTEVSFGDLDEIVTEECVYQGSVVSQIPEELLLGTAFGTLTIKRHLISRMSFLQETLPQPALETAFCLGIGVKYFKQAPFIVLNTSLGKIGWESGLWGMGSSEAFMIFYLTNLKYYLPVAFLEHEVRVFLGGGIFGMIIAGGGSVFPMGFLHILGGFELPLSSFGFPITFFAGIDWLEHTGLGGWHIGARLDFSIR